MIMQKTKDKKSQKSVCILLIVFLSHLENVKDVTKSNSSLIQTRLCCVGLGAILSLRLNKIST